MKIKFDKEKKEWIELPPYSKEGFYIDRKLFQKLMAVKMIQKKRYDCVFIIDGDRRTGKSILGMTCAWIISDETLTINNFAIGAADATKKIKKLPDRSILFLDEGSTIFSSKDSMKKELKQLIKIMDVIGQKEMVFIIILPSFFDLIKSISVRISRFLIHVYTDKDLNRGRFGFYSRKGKKLLYLMGKKNYDSYKHPPPKFKGRFTDFHVPFYDEYLKLKKRTLIKVLDNKPEKIPEEYKIQFRKEMVKRNLGNKDKLKTKQIASLFGLSERTIETDAKFIRENQNLEK